MLRDMELEKQRRPISVAEYHRMAELGFFGPDERLELIRGEIVRKMSIGNRHRGTVNRLGALLVPSLHDRVVVQVQNAVVLDSYSEIEPDIALLAINDAAFGARSAYPADTFAAIEVSDSSLKMDLRVKVPLYAETAVRELWVVDLRSQLIRVHRDPTPDGYGLVSVAHRGRRVAFECFPETEFEVAEILGPETAEVAPESS